MSMNLSAQKDEPEKSQFRNEFGLNYYDLNIGIDLGTFPQLGFFYGRDVLNRKVSLVPTVFFGVGTNRDMSLGGALKFGYLKNRIGPVISVGYYAIPHQSFGGPYCTGGINLNITKSIGFALSVGTQYILKSEEIEDIWRLNISSTLGFKF